MPDEPVNELIEFDTDNTASAEEAALPSQFNVDAPKSGIKSAAERDFDLFDAGRLSEHALLIALGVLRAGYDPSEDMRLRALTAFETERLSEDGLTRVLGG